MGRRSLFGLFLLPITDYPFPIFYAIVMQSNRGGFVMGNKEILCFIIMTAFLLVASGCGDSGRGPAPAAAGGAPAPQTEKAGGVVVPADGTPGVK